ncbi:MAG: helix-turn-helix domain-containing protein [Candidatus Atribacteria bacterium]|nr:helix-turn-helix domain-containing protein [Candidatus Atribacteria bacterium]
MQRENQNKQHKAGEEKKEGYVVIPNYFLREWVRVLGVGPVVLYQELLTYCHKEKYIAWPTMDSLCKQMGIAKTTLLRYQNTLIRFGLIKNIRRGKSTTGHYRNNIYQIASLSEFSGCPDPKKIIDFIGSKMKPDRYQNDTCVGSKMKLSLVSKRYPNNSNLNITNTTATTKEEKDAVAVVDFKKLKEKGEEKMRAPYGSKEKERYTGQAPYSSKKHCIGQVIRKRMVKLDFKEEFIKKILKEYSMKKIEEKLDLLMKRKNIQSPAGWLRATLKNDYRGKERETCSRSYPLKGEETRRMDSRLLGNDIKDSRNDISANVRLPRRFAPRNDRKENKNILSREEALGWIREIRRSLGANG